MLDPYSKYSLHECYDGKTHLLTSLAIVDVNGDDKLDIVVTNYYNMSIMIYFSSGNGKFEKEKIYPCKILPYSMKLTDMNKDG
jgi:hypothetical protein